MRLALPLLLLLSSCYAFPWDESYDAWIERGFPQVTTCGLRAPAAVDLPRLQAELDFQLAGLAPLGLQCAELQYWTLFIHHPDAGQWIYAGQEVAGLCACDVHQIQVSEDWAALTHEMLHLHDCPVQNANHLGWDVNGYQAAIEALHPR